MIKMLTLVFCFSLLSASWAKEIAFSFDDGLNPEQNPKAEYINDQILKILKQNKIKAIVFPSVSKIGGDDGLKLIQEWGKQGHSIGNHSNLHLNLNKDEVALAAYLNDMAEGHLAFSKLKGFVPRYRFPFLKEGNTREKQEGVRQWLQSNHYLPGAVTVDASDWYYNQLYLRYKQDNDVESLDKLKQAYIHHLLERAEYYDDLADQTIGRSPRHMMLLHVREINAVWLGEVIQHFQNNGWTFIDSESAFQDSVYKVQTNTLPAGESLIWNIAKTYGNTTLRYPAEDAPYEYATLEKFGLSVQP